MLEFLLELLWSKTLSVPSFGHYWKQPIALEGPIEQEEAKRHAKQIKSDFLSYDYFFVELD